MDLQCLQENLKGQSIQVNGHTYAIGPDLIAREVNDVDAAKLLKFASWKKSVSRSPAQSPEVQKVAEVPAPTPAPVAQAEESKPNEWPDPKESMELDYLQKMADAYEVKHDSKTTKKALVKAIHKAMYE